jgi:hypothetical protein
MFEFRIWLCFREEEVKGSFRIVFQGLHWKPSLGRSRLALGIMMKLTVSANEYIVNTSFDDLEEGVIELQAASPRCPYHIQGVS